MFSIRLLAAVALATSGLAFASSSGAAPANGATAPLWSGQVVQAQHRSGDRDRDEWRRRDGGRDGHRRWEGERRYYSDRDRHRDLREHTRWRVRHHPRHQYWVGRRLPRDNYVVIYNYDDYYLPPPHRGYYYARIDNDIYLVAAATRSIIDAFLLLDAIGR